MKPAKLLFVSSMDQQARVCPNDEMTKKLDCRLQEHRLFDCLMNRPQALRGEIFGRHWDHHEVRRKHRVPTAEIQVWWAVYQDQVKARNGFPEGRQGELSHAGVLGFGDIVLRELCIGTNDRNS